MGHIKTSVGKEEVSIDTPCISATQLIEKMREMGQDDPRLGFTKFNTLLVVNDGEAFTAASDNRVLTDGDRVLLLPFSHGG